MIEVAESKGWIKLHRKIQDCFIWTDKPYDKARAWVDLLLLTTHSDKKLIIDGNIVVIHRGSYMTSREKLAQKWGWSVGKVDRFLSLLKREEMITTDSTPKGTVVTIVNYNEYQVADLQDGITNSTADDTSDSTTGSTTDDTLNSTIDGTQNKNVKNEKNVKNVKNVKNNIFVPPTVQEVKDYLSSVGSSLDAESFVAFYESKGWMIGKNKMKSWKSAIVTWEKKAGIKRVRPKEQPLPFEPTEEEHINLWDDEE